MGIEREVIDYVNKSLITVDGINVLKMESVRELAKKSGYSIKQAELYLLEQNILPYRYIGTAKFTGLQGMISLLKSRVAIIGCGGVGGFVCELCARLGVGEILLFDGDVYEESNINRQIGCIEENIGKYKAEVMANRIKDINSDIKVFYKNTYLQKSHFTKELTGCHVVIDSVDNIQDSLDISNACKEMMIPFIHGCIGNSSINVGVSMPDVNFLENIYSYDNTNDKLMGSPATTVMICAALQVGELVKIICEIGESLSGYLLHYNWLSNDLIKIDLSNNNKGGHI